jgi:hypothetical protein
MEAKGVERRVKELWADTIYDTHVSHFVSDNDSTMQARLRWPHRGAIDAGLIAKWLTYINENGKDTKKKCAPGPYHWSIQQVYKIWQTRIIESVDTDPRCSSFFCSSKIKIIDDKA